MLHFRFRRRIVPGFGCPVFLIKQLFLLSFVLTMVFMIVRINVDTIKDVFSQRFYIFRANWMLNFDSNVETEYPFDQWQFIGDREHKFQVYSAYYDDRMEIVQNYHDQENRTAFASVRLITILPLKVNKLIVDCNLVYRNGTISKSRAMKVITIQEYFHTTFIATFVICALTRYAHEEQIEFPVAVGITYDYHPSMQNITSLVKIHYSKSKSSTISKLPTLEFEQNEQLSVCVGPAQENFKNVLRVVEFVEFYKILGATKFYFYNTSITPDVDKVFRYYERAGDVEILQWHIEGYAFEQELRYDGIFAMMNDCLYRSTIVDNFKYTAIVDFDEIIVPLNPNATLLKYIQDRDKDNIHSFCFENVLFFYTFEKFTDSVPANSPNKFLYSQVLLKRTQKANGYHDRSKVIAKGKNVLELGNHMVFMPLKDKDEFQVPPTDALLHHYRDMCLEKYCSAPTINDFSARNYGSTLWTNVDKVCGKIFLNGICAFNNSDKDLKLI